MSLSHDQLSTLTSITEVATRVGNATGELFAGFDFLCALERSASVQPAKGWSPSHLIWQAENDEKFAWAPSYLKWHSFGDYVFDFDWANFYHSMGRRYFPKRVIAVPYTPVCEARFFGLTDRAFESIISALPVLSQEEGSSGIHLNYPRLSKYQRAQLITQGWQERLGIAYRWVNDRIDHFDEFLDGLKRKRRRLIRSERQKVHHNFNIRWLEGEELKVFLGEQFFHFYSQTYLSRSGHAGYLNQEFFRLLAEHMVCKAQICTATPKGQNKVFAAALFFIDNNKLYGRYWGANDFFPGLHFELCYYQGIERCIERGWSEFDPGIQGEHKHRRGFTAEVTSSFVYLHDGALAEPVYAYCARENKQILDNIAYINQE